MRTFLASAFLLLAGCDAVFVHRISANSSEVSVADIRDFVMNQSKLRGMPCEYAPRWQGIERLFCEEPWRRGRSYTILMSEIDGQPIVDVMYWTACCEPKWFKAWRKDLSQALVSEFGSKVDIATVTGGE